MTNLESDIEMKPTRCIDIQLASQAITVQAGGVEIARSSAALVLHEDGHDAVYYIPRQDVVLALLAPSDHTTHCPFKGDASYFDLAAETAPVANIAWSYEQPLAEVAQIAGHLAFCGNKCEIRIGD